MTIFKKYFNNKIIKKESDKFIFQNIIFLIIYIFFIRLSLYSYSKVDNRSKINNIIHALILKLGIGKMERLYLKKIIIYINFYSDTNLEKLFSIITFLLIKS